MSDIQRTEAALAKVVAWAEARPDLSWKEGVKNALDTLTEEMATLERELNEARAERDSLDSITNRLTTETRELCELFRKATGYTVDEYTAMIKEVKAENSETCLGNSAEAKLTECMAHADALADTYYKADSHIVRDYREWRAEQ